MHIIKISPVSFKIILTKEDLKCHGVENILHHTELCSDFFEEIIRETNSLFENPFTEGAVDAEFFESKDGGGELFISRSNRNTKSITYIYSTESIEHIFALCKRLNISFKPKKSRLFFDGKNYLLLLTYPKRNSILASFISEYGALREAGKLCEWIAEEHAKLLVEGDAVGTIAKSLSGYTKSNDTPL